MAKPHMSLPLSINTHTDRINGKVETHKAKGSQRRFKNTHLKIFGFKLFSSYHHLQLPFFPANPFLIFTLFTTKRLNICCILQLSYDLPFHFLYPWKFLLQKEGSSKSSSSVTVGELHLFCFTFEFRSNLLISV